MCMYTFIVKPNQTKSERESDIDLLGSIVFLVYLPQQTSLEIGYRTFALVWLDHKLAQYDGRTWEHEKCSYSYM